MFSQTTIVVFFSLKLLALLSEAFFSQTSFLDVYIFCIHKQFQVIIVRHVIFCYLGNGQGWEEDH